MTMASITYASIGSEDVFVAKLDAVTGTATWAAAFGSQGPDHSWSIAAGSDGVYILGEFQGASCTFGSIVLVNAGQADVFLAKLSLSSGAVLWAKTFGGAGIDYPAGLAVDPTGSSIAITGSFSSSSIAFGSTVLVNTQTDTEDAFIAKFYSSGDLDWAYKLGGTGRETARAIDIDSRGRAVVAGDFTSNTATIGSIVLSATASNNIFVLNLVSSHLHLYILNDQNVNLDRCLSAQDADVTQAPTRAPTLLPVSVSICTAYPFCTTG